MTLVKKKYHSFKNVFHDLCTPEDQENFTIALTQTAADLLWKSQVWWHTPVIPEFVGQRRAGLCKFQASQGYRVRLCFKQINPNIQVDNELIMN